MFLHNIIQGGLLKRIPKAARLLAASLFERCLRGVVVCPSDLTGWHKLFEFASCFLQPPRGGKHRNLSAQILAQIAMFDQGVGIFPPRAVKRSKSKKKVIGSATRTVDEDAARRSSIKLEDGDVHGAVRILCSNEKYTPPDASSYAILQSKHPPSPLDRRKILGAVSSPLIVQLSNIHMAVRSFAP